MLITAAVVLGFLLTVMKGQQVTEAVAGCGWSGHMPGPGASGPCPSPVSNQTCPVTPTYQQIQSLWPCPSYNRTTGGQYYGNCTTANGSNPLCTNFTPITLGCCCPLDGCWTPPYFNWIIGVCKGSGCGNYRGTPATQMYKDVGSQLIVNYVASYQWNSTTTNWQIVEDSSFNTDGSRPEFDCVEPNGGLNKSLAWMQPQPGGAADWTWGYYPAGVKGVGPPGMLFVLSVE